MVADSGALCVWNSLLSYFYLCSRMITRRYFYQHLTQWSTDILLATTKCFTAVLGPMQGRIGAAL